MFKIGLTGGIGTGKSTVSSLLKQSGFSIVDADLISREVFQIYPNILEDIRSEFGEDFFDEQGNLLRRKLGDYIFKFSEERKKLDHIMIPYIKKEILQRIEEYDRSGEKLSVLDAPTLIEHNLHKVMDVNILVWVDKATQIKRLCERDNLTIEQAVNRINSQMPLDSKIKLVDFVIDNSSDIDVTREQVAKLVCKLRSYHK